MLEEIDLHEVITIRLDAACNVMAAVTVTIYGFISVSHEHVLS